MVLWELSRVPGSSPGVLRGSHGTMGAQPIPRDSPSTMGARASPFPWYLGSTAGFLEAHPGFSVVPIVPWELNPSPVIPLVPWELGLPRSHGTLGAQPGSWKLTRVLRGSHGTMGAQPVPRGSPGTMGARVFPFPWYLGSTAGFLEAHPGFSVVPMVPWELNPSPVIPLVPWELGLPRSHGTMGAQPGSWELSRVPRGSHGTMGAQPVPRGSPGTMGARASPFPWYLGSTAGFLEAHP